MAAHHHQSPGGGVSKASDPLRQGRNQARVYVSRQEQLIHNNIPCHLPSWQGHLYDQQGTVGDSTHCCFELALPSSNATLVKHLCCQPTAPGHIDVSEEYDDILDLQIVCRHSFCLIMDTFS